MTYHSQWVLFLVRIPQWHISYVQPNKNLLSLWRDTNRSETLTRAQLTVCFTRFIDGEMIQIQTQSVFMLVVFDCCVLKCFETQSHMWLLLSAGESCCSQSQWMKLIKSLWTWTHGSADDGRDRTFIHVWTFSSKTDDTAVRVSGWYER